MLLAVDVGNSETSFGLFDGRKLVHHWRVTSSPRQTRDEIYVLCHALLQSAGRNMGEVTDLAVSCVVPELVPAYRGMGDLLGDTETLVIDHRTVPSLKILNLDPATVGADRLVNAVAAAELYGQPSIVVDLGTATTLDVIGGRGEYAGGVIAPGILTAAGALFARGARLSRVEVIAPPRVVGRTTEESMQAGIFLGAVFAVDGLVRAIMEEQKFPTGTPVVATGGLASAVQQASRTITAIDPDLTLTGIRLVWERYPAAK
jgi:type III pantothenate kinase